MAYKEITEFNETQGLEKIFVYSSDVLPIFIPLVLFSIFVVSLLSTYFAQARRKGEGDFPASFAVASWLTAIISLVFSLFENVIQTGTIVVSMALAIVGIIWLYVSRMEASGF